MIRGGRVTESLCPDWAAGAERALSEAIVSVTRELARQLPPPRGQPFFGLEFPDGDPSPLNQFSRRGIFRKYESVLDLGSGFGAAARWWNAQFGCRVVGVEPTSALAAAAAVLSARAGLGRQTSFVGGAFAALPFRERYFTHVWCVERIPDPLEADARLREVHRVVRPGGYVALQASGSEPHWVHSAVAALRSLGFVGIETGAVEPGRIAESSRLARARLLRHLESKDAAGAKLAVKLRERYAAAAETHRAVAQVFARRTSS